MKEHPGYLWVLLSQNRFSYSNCERDHIKVAVLALDEDLKHAEGLHSYTSPQKNKYQDINP